VLRSQKYPAFASESVDTSRRCSTDIANVDNSSKDASTYRDDFDWNFPDDDLFAFLLATPTLPSTNVLSRSHPSPCFPRGSTRSLPDGEWLRCSAEAGRKAVLASNRIIQGLPESLMVMVESESTASTFFEDCLDLFFRHHLTVVPVIHKPTFNPRECNSTVLLYMLALGSCFLPHPTYKVSCHGHP
jgi:hypothetical protein